MKTPLYQEVCLSTQNLDQEIAEGPWGEGPLSIQFVANSDVEFQRMALARLKQVLKQKGISPLFPYPIYVVSAHALGRIDFPLVSKESQLPAFFKSKRRELTAKEIPFLKKIQLLANKVANSKVDEKMAFIKSMSKKNRVLFDLTCETHFYQTIKKKLKENEKNKRSELRPGKKP